MDYLKEIHGRASIKSVRSQREVLHNCSRILGQPVASSTPENSPGLALPPERVPAAPVAQPSVVHPSPVRDENVSDSVTSQFVPVSATPDCEANLQRGISSGSKRGVLRQVQLPAIRRARASESRLALFASPRMPIKYSRRLVPSEFGLRTEVHEAEGGAKIGDECIVCRDQPINCVLIPCGHYALCRECASRERIRSGNCPCCRSRVEYVQRVVKMTAN